MAHFFEKTRDSLKKHRNSNKNGELRVPPTDWDSAGRSLKNTVGQWDSLKKREVRLMRSLAIDIGGCMENFATIS